MQGDLDEVDYTSMIVGAMQKSNRLSTVRRLYKPSSISSSLQRRLPNIKCLGIYPREF